MSSNCTRDGTSGQTKKCEDLGSEQDRSLTTLLWIRYDEIGVVWRGVVPVFRSIRDLRRSELGEGMGHVALAGGVDVSAKEFARAGDMPELQKRRNDARFDRKARLLYRDINL